MKSFLHVLAFCLLFYGLPKHSSAQTECGTDRIHEKLFAADSAYREEFLRDERQLKTAANNPFQRKSVVHTIPVVVHVVHVGESLGLGSNISDSQIMNAVQGATDRFRNIIGNGVDVEMEFCLAVRDPDCNPTTGIIRIDASGFPDYVAHGIKHNGANGVEEEEIKDLSRWPFADYINIWVVNHIQGAAAYANFPSSTNANQGIVIRASSMRQSSETLAHEIGHYLNLRHTFNGDEDDTECPPDDDCTDDGDRVCDTPPHKRSDCFTLNPCTASGIWDNARYNYMSYCNNRELFTQGQKDRMLLSLNTHAGRITLLNSLGCTPVASTCFAYDLQQTTASSSTSITWSSDCVADAFALEYRVAGDSAWTTVDSVTPPFAVDLFPCSIKHDWRVQALCDTSASAFSQINSFTVLCPGIQQGHADGFNFKVYPNPGNGRFHLSASSGGVDRWQVKIQDITGRAVYEKSFPQVQQIDDRMQLTAPPGFYLLQITNSTHSASGLLIIQ